MKIRDLIKSKPPPVTIHSDQSIQEAMRTLIENKIGALIVINDDNNPLGIITERDIFRLAYRFRGDMMDMNVADNMTCKLVLGKPEFDLESVEQIMTNNRIRHLPVIDQTEKLCGIVSIGDVVKARIGENPTTAAND